MAQIHSSGFITLDGTVQEVEDLVASTPLAGRRCQAINFYADKNNASEIYVGTSTSMDTTTGAYVVGIIYQAESWGVEVHQGNPFHPNSFCIKAANGMKVLITGMEV